MMQQVNAMDVNTYLLACPRPLYLCSVNVVSVAACCIHEVGGCRHVRGG